MVDEGVAAAAAHENWSHKDFDQVFKPTIPIARIFLDEGHMIKNPSTRSSISVRMTDCEKLYIVSATALSNSVADVFGITYQLEKFTEKLGITSKCNSPISLYIGNGV